MSYVEGFLVPVPNGNREAYRALAAKHAPILLECGATRVVEAWQAGMKSGETHAFQGTIKAAPGEDAIFSWIEWPSRETRDTGWEKFMRDERAKPDAGMPFDTGRIISGVFEILVDEPAHPHGAG